MIAGSVLACETLCQLIGCGREQHNANAMCAKYLRVASGARVTSEEYTQLTVGFVMVCALVAILVSGLVRKFGWTRETGRPWRLNGFGLAMPWMGGLTLLFGLFHLRGR